MPDPAEVGAAVARERAPEVVFCTQSETSTGVVADVQALKAAVGDAVARRRRGLLARRRAARDGRLGRSTSSSPGSQKALMCPPGPRDGRASPTASGTRCRPSRSFYFDWRATRKAQEAFDAAFTPAVSLIRGLDVALGMILDAGLEAAFERHVRLGRATRAGVKAMGLELFSPDDDTSAVVTAIRAPDGIDSTDAPAPPARPARRDARARAGRAQGRASSGSATSAGSTSSTSPPRSPPSSSR